MEIYVFTDCFYFLKINSYYYLTTGNAEILNLVHP